MSGLQRIFFRLLWFIRGLFEGSITRPPEAQTVEEVNPHVAAIAIPPSTRKSREDEYIKALGKLVEMGFNPWAPFTQAWHETGGFEKVIGRSNYWGIKKPRSWSGGKVHEVRTHEFIAGVRTPTVALFADWETPEEALGWYAGLVERLYPEAWNNRSKPILFFYGLVSGRFQWATDPSYATKLEAVYRRLLNDQDLSSRIGALTRNLSA